MYIFKSDPSDALDDPTLRTSKTSTNANSLAETMLSRFQAPVVQAQFANLGTSLPTGIVLSNLVDAVALAGVISTIGQPANQSLMTPKDDAELLAVPQSNVDEKLSKDILGALESSSLRALPITTLSDASFEQNQLMVDGMFAIKALPHSSLFTVSESTGSGHLSLLPPGAPVVIRQLSDDGPSVTMIHNGVGNVQITDFKPADVVSQTFINTGLGVLTITTPATNVSSLSLSGKVEFTATGIEVTSGITVSGESDSSNVTLYITGGAQSASGSSDFIKLGDGNNFVFNAGDGAIYVNLGAGANSVILAGVGASGIINLATNDLGTPDFVAIAANGLDSPEALAAASLITINGLNTGDAISFLGDLGGQLVWAGGSAQKSQVTIPGEADANLVSYISAAQEQASQAHSIAWFNFDGATYIFETAGGVGASASGDTLVKLTGVATFTNDQVELSAGIFHLIA
jgi:hypothetical protein